MMTKRLALLGIALLLALTLAAAAEAKEEAVAGPTVVRLVQSPGAVEPQNLELRPGRYLFMVTNQGVDHEVDFVLKRVEGIGSRGEVDPKPVRSARLGRLVRSGETSSTSIVDLKPGTYTYSSPLNHTPEYTLTVR
jgi:hypothetical protein